jgi:hypothetical protein
MTPPENPYTGERRSRPVRRRRDDGQPRCEFCREPIIWAYPVARRGTKAEAHPRPMPLDAEPTEHGLRTLYREPPTSAWPQGRPRTGVLTKGQAAGWRASGKPTYQQHYKTCVKSMDWGKAGKRYGSREVQK